MKTTNKTNSDSKNSKKNQTTTELDTMQKKVLKEQRAIEVAAKAQKRLEKATARFELLKNGNEKTKGFANITLNYVHKNNAVNANVQGAIDALNTFIKVVAKANSSLDKKIVAALKGEAAQTILQQVTVETLPLYIDNKGMYKVETLYRLVASTAKNSELRTILNNIKAGK